MNNININLFRHQAAVNILCLKELVAACLHLFLKKEKEFGGLFAMGYVGTLREA